MVDYTVDLIVFGISKYQSKNIRELSKKKLSVILLNREKEPFKNHYCLPGGYVKDNETAEEAAQRVLKKETGLDSILLTMVNINDDIDRDPRNRTISVSYIALIDIDKITQKLSDNASWFNVDYIIKDNKITVTLNNDNIHFTYDIGRKIIDKKSDNEKYYLIEGRKLAFDHEKILLDGIMNLRKKVKSTDIVFNLMPEYFTIGELEQVYEAILKEKIVNSAFRRAMKSKFIVTDKVIKTGGHRPSNLCKYNSDNN